MSNSPDLVFFVAMGTTTGPLRISIVSEQDFVCAAMEAAITMRTPHSVVLTTGTDMYEEACCKLVPPAVALVDLSLYPQEGIDRIAWIAANQPAAMPLAFGHKVAQHWVRRALAAGSHGYVALCGTLAEVPQALEALGTTGEYCTPLVNALRQRMSSGPPVQPRLLRDLTKREREVLQLACDEQELSYKMMGAKLRIGERTVETHMHQLYRKLRVGTRTGLVLVAVRGGLLDE